jgi:hypothetical protein
LAKGQVKIQSVLYVIWQKKYGKGKVKRPSAIKGKKKGSGCLYLLFSRWISGEGSTVVQVKRPSALYGTWQKDTLKDQVRYSVLGKQVKIPSALYGIWQKDTVYGKGKYQVKRPSATNGK